MKLFSQICTGVVALACMQTAVLAKPIPKEDLDKVNATIQRMFSDIDRKSGVAIVLNGGTEDEKGVLDSFDLSGSFRNATEEMGGRLTLSFSKDIHAGISFSFVKKLGVDVLTYAVTGLANLAKSLEQQKVYRLNSSLVLTDVKLFSAKLSLTPISPEANAIRGATVDATSDLESGKTMVSFEGIFNPKDALAEQGRASLNNIFNALRDGKQPDQKDIEEIGLIYSEILKSLTDSANGRGLN